MSTDIPNAFIQAPLENKLGECVIMKITGVLVDILLEKSPSKYMDYVVYEKGKKVIYIVCLKAIYGMLIAALEWYKKFRNVLETIGFIFNDYDPCVANKELKGSLMTKRFHVDDCLSSHISSKENDNFLKWLKKMYGEHGEVKATRGKKHDYLGMMLIFEDQDVLVDMREYLRKMFEEFPIKFK